jgi:acyl-CoA dehydrogenase
MKVTTQGEDVINNLWDVIAAKGFEKDMYFEMAARDIRALPKLEGTVHVNIALIVKFMQNYFFNTAEMPAVGRRSDAANDAFLFDQGPTKGLSGIQFHDYRKVFAGFDLPNVHVFLRQIDALVEMLVTQPPTAEQMKDTDWLLAVGELFTLVVYCQLVLENAATYAIDDELIDQIFDVTVRDFSKFAVELHGKQSTTEGQAQCCRKIIRTPAHDWERYQRVWHQHVYALRDAYRMTE